MSGLRFTLCLLLCAISACKPKKNAALNGSDVEAVKEASIWYEEKLAAKEGEPTELNSGSRGEVLDFKGVGDSGWVRSNAEGRMSTPPNPGFGNAIQAIDQNKVIFKSDLSFINWEAVVGVKCDTIRGSTDFYFLSNPENIIQAYERGFNIFGVANNHAQDCSSGLGEEGGVSLHGPLMTAEQMEKISSKYPILWHGAGKAPFEIATKKYSIKGKEISVAFASITLINWSIPNIAYLNYNEPSSKSKGLSLLQSLKQTPADVRVLSIHTQDGSGNNKPEGNAFRLLKDLSQEFITNYGGNIVFGQGPHTYGGVKVIQKSDGKKGVVFTSLGNFIHQGLSIQSDNYMGRAIFDIETMELKEVQALPLTNKKTTVSFYSNDQLKQNISQGLGIKANFNWQTGSLSDGTKQIGAYYARF